MANLSQLSSASDGLYAEVLSKIQTLINLIRSTNNIDELPSLLMEHLVDLFKPDIASYYVKDSFTSNYRKVASFPESFWRDTQIQEKFNVRPIKGGAIGYAIEQKEIVFIDNPAEAELRGEYIPVDPKIASEVVVPIIAQGTFDPEEKVAPAIIVFSRYAGHEFCQEEYQLLNIVGSLITSAYNDSTEKALKEKRINFLSSILNLQTVDLDDIFKNFLIAVTRLVPSKFLALWLYNELDDKLVIRSFHPSRIEQKKVTFESLDRLVLDCNECLSGEVIKSTRSKVFMHLDDGVKFSNPKFAKEHGIEWFMSIPILDIYKRPLGVVSISPYGKPEDFSEEAIDALCEYISPIANTIRLISLLNEEDLLVAFDEFFQNMLEFQDQKAWWDSLAELISRQMNCAACSVFLEEPDGKLHLKGTTGLIDDPPYQSVVYEPNQGLTGKTFTSGQPVTYYKEDKERYEGIHISKFREKIPGRSKSIIMVPILDKNGAPIGVIRSNNKEQAPSRHVGRFTKEDLVHLQKISKIIANAHSQILWVKEREKERERSMNSLHHEILSPLDGITQHIEWMKHNFSMWKAPTDWEKDRVLLKLDDMEQNSKLIDSVVTCLGRFDENIRLRTRVVSFPNLINTCRGFLKNEAQRKQIKISVDSIYVSKIRCDELQLMSVIYNLLRNAVKYSDPKEHKKFLRIYVSANERDYFTLSFSDNGIGVVPGEEERIFQKYERGSNAAKFFPEGSGLGLAFCRSIMGRHGGEIYVEENSLSKPTVFHLKFPKWMKVS